jgi:hypothetical protein
MIQVAFEAFRALAQTAVDKSSMVQLLVEVTELRPRQKMHRVQAELQWE